MSTITSYKIKEMKSLNNIAVISSSNDYNKAIGRSLTNKTCVEELTEVSHEARYNSIANKKRGDTQISRYRTSDSSTTSVEECSLYLCEENISNITDCDGKHSSSKLLNNKSTECSEDNFALYLPDDPTDFLNDKYPKQFSRLPNKISGKLQYMASQKATESKLSFFAKLRKFFSPKNYKKSETKTSRSYLQEFSFSKSKFGKPFYSSDIDHLGHTSCSTSSIFTSDN